MRFQTETGSNKYLKHSSTLPYAFTEQGVATLSSILHTDIAVKKSIIVMHSFVAMRKYISSSLIKNNIEHKLLDHDNRYMIILDCQVLNSLYKLSILLIKLDKNRKILYSK